MIKTNIQFIAINNLIYNKNKYFKKISLVAKQTHKVLVPRIEVDTLSVKLR